MAFSLSAFAQPQVKEALLLGQVMKKGVTRNYAATLTPATQKWFLEPLFPSLTVRRFIFL
jgi:hypothetical protein